MAIQDTSINVFPLTAGAIGKRIKLYKIYLHTQADPAVQELIVAARCLQDAKDMALGHVKKSNPYKGSRTQTQAIKVTRVLGGRETGTDGCVVIHRIPLDVFSNAATAAVG